MSSASSSSTSAIVDNSASWSPAVYGKYAEERTRPGIDLIEGAKRAFLHRSAPFSRTLDDVRVICDLGSGTGRFEPHLLAHFPAAQRVIGIDGSDAMLESARTDVRATLEAAGRGALAERVTFQRGDISTLALDTKVDLLFSNSALHWLPDHDVAVRHWLSQVRVGGVFAVQLPNNFSEPSHTCMLTVAQRMEDGGSLQKGTVKVLEEKAARVHPGGPLAYHRLLRERCSTFVDVWDTTRYDTLREPEGIDKHGIPVHPVVAFTHGSSLANMLMYIPKEQHREFLTEYTREMHTHYPTWIERNPTTGKNDVVCVFPFSRWFLVGVVDKQ